MEEGVLLRIRNGMALMVLVVVCLQPLGFFLKNSDLLMLGKATVVSPLPIPFRENNGLENYTLYKEYDVVFKDGSSESFAEPPASILKGPHRRKIALITPYMWSLRLSHRLTDPVFDYTICRESIFLDQRPVHTATINFYSARTQEKLGIVSHLCL